MNATILLVDDDESLREVTQYHLTNAGYQVHTAKDGLEALGLFSKYKPEVVITDIGMPEMDGFQLIYRIKEISDDTIFIIITAQGSIESFLDAIEIRVYDYIHKPFSAETIKLSVEKALNIARSGNV